MKKDTFPMADGRAAELIKLQGPCAFLTCTARGPHSHPVCPDCGAVRFGNAFCTTCRSNWPVQSRIEGAYENPAGVA